MAYDNTAYEDNNYQKWREIHTDAFGELFSDAFEDNEAAQYMLTAALIDISKRRFDSALIKLNELENLCSFSSDEAVIQYFKGLVYEMLQDEAAMTEHYEALRKADEDMDYLLAFHPYYRTAKFAQRNAECSKAIFYYQQALAFYETAEQTPTKSAVAAHILYDIATVCLYSHRYDLAEQSLALSEHYDSADNEHRRFVTAILKAVKGACQAGEALIDTLSDPLRSIGAATVRAIGNGTDFHYCIIPQDQAARNDFIQWFSIHRLTFEQAISDGETEAVEKRISAKLTDTFPFMQKNLTCRIEPQHNGIIVKCKTYCVKTLQAEYDALFPMLRRNAAPWQFVAVEESDPYPLHPMT